MFWIFFLQISTTLISSSKDFGHISACHGQPTKTINCKDGEVIFIQRAMYGSFKTGDCGVSTTRECETNVTRYIEGKCSGLESCNVTLADDYLMSNIHTYVPPCDNSVAKSLEVKFQCKKYYNNPDEECRNGPIMVMADHGFLSGLPAKEMGKGSKKCPWSFDCSSNKTLLLMLWDFNTFNYKEPLKCLIYAIVKSSNLVTTVCSGVENRQRYTKCDDMVEVTMYHGEGLRYLIEFEVLKCPHYDVPSFLKKLGGQGSTISLQCVEGHSKIHAISCVDGVWPRLLESDCLTSADVSSTTFVNPDRAASNSTLLIAGVIALAVIISLSIIFVGLYCLNACPFQRNHEIPYCSKAAAMHPLEFQGKYSSENLFLQPTQSMRELYPMLANPSHRMAAMQRDYATTLQMRQMAGYYADHTGWCPTHGPYHLGSSNTIDKKSNMIKMKRNLSTPLSNCEIELNEINKLPTASLPPSPFYHELDQVTLKDNKEPEVNDETDKNLDKNL